MFIKYEKGWKVTKMGLEIKKQEMSVNSELAEKKTRV